MCSVVSALFKRTSEIQLPLLERVEVGQGVVDEVCREPHFGGGLWFVLLGFLGAVGRAVAMLAQIRGKCRGSVGSRMWPVTESLLHGRGLGRWDLVFALQNDHRQG